MCDLGISQDKCVLLKDTINRVMLLYGMQSFKLEFTFNASILGTLHFIRFYSVCKGQKDLQTKKYNFFNYNLTSIDMVNGLSQVYCIKPEGRIH